MNRYVIIILIVFFLVSGYRLYAGSFSPWKTVCFSSINQTLVENLSEKNKFEQLVCDNPDYVKKDIFMYAFSTATDETVFGGKDPYQISIIFFTYGNEKEITINTVEILNDDLNTPKETTKTILQTEHKTLYKGKDFEQYTSDYSKAIYKFPNYINLRNYNKELKMKVSLTIEGETFEQIFNLKRYVKKGLFKWIY